MTKNNKLIAAVILLVAFVGVLASYLKHEETPSNQSEDHMEKMRKAKEEKAKANDTSSKEEK